MRQCPKCGKRFLAAHVKVCDTDGSALTEVAVVSARDRLVGAMVGDRYQIDGTLGDGGMGVVYRATELRTRKVFAIKVLRQEYSSEEDLVMRFQLEAEAVADIRSKNIVRVFEFGMLPDQSRYFVMEYLEGASLGQLLAKQGRSLKHRDRFKPLPEWLTIHISKQLCDGLEAAHARSIVHRDMKPDNVHLVKEGAEEYRVKILDFGIAKVQGSKSARTRTGSVFGTPHYMSPEQAQGERDIDARTDVYATGVLMYQMVSGRVPFDADNLMGILTAHLYHQPIAPSNYVEPNTLSDGLESVILKALSKPREGRYRSMSEMREDLERVERGEVPLALEDTDLTTARFTREEFDRAAKPAAIRPIGNDNHTVPAGRVKSVPGLIGGRTEFDTGPPRPGSGEMPIAVPVGTGQSIPPVTASSAARGSRAPLIAVGLSLLALTTLSTAALIVMRRGDASTPANASTRPVPPAPYAAVPSVAPVAVAPPVVAAAQTAVGVQAMPETSSPTVQLASDPPGAVVSRQGRRIGVTPLEVERPSAGQTVVYTLAAEGRSRVPVTVRADMPRAIQVSLPSRSSGGRGPAAAPAGSGNSTGGGHQGELIDPWAASGNH